MSSSENENEVSISDLKEIIVNSNCSENDSALPNTEDEPLRPILNKYMPKRFSTEKYERDFQSSWYKTYSWLGYSIARSTGYCYPCGKYGNYCIEFKNWKKTDKFLKHSKSEAHKTSMVK